MSIVGVELTADRASAIVRTRGGSAGAHVEVPFDPSQPSATVDALRAAIGAASGIHLSIGLAHLDVAPVTVPRVARATARAIVATNADRFFLGSNAPAVGINASASIGFAAPADQVARWVAALEQWAPVRVVEAAPESILRGLTAHGVRDAHLALAAGAQDHGVVDIADGALVRVRRVPALRGAAELNGAAPLSDRLTRTIPAAAFAAWGATAADAGDESAMLLSPAMAATFAARRLWRGVRAAALLGVSMVALCAALSHWRSRTLAALEARVAELTPQAAVPLALRATVARANAEQAAIAATPAVDPLTVLATLSNRLPVDAVLQRLHFDGASWQLIGTARTTESVVRRLSSDSQLVDVRLAGPTTRFRDGRSMVESFTLSFRTRAPETPR